MTSVLPRDLLRRIVTSLLVAEIGRARGNPGGGRWYDEEEAAWRDEAPLSVGGVPLDSLEIVHATAALHEMFALDRLDRAQARGGAATVGAWIDSIATVLAHDDATVTVHTSGSTGRPKPCVHALSALQAEAAGFAAMLPPTRRIVALVPAHHLYGMIWTVLLPAALGVPVVTASVATLPRLDTGDLIVAVPDQWQALARLIRHWPMGVSGVSAAAPLEDVVAEDVLASGLERLLDVYGASETGGIALREAPGGRYRLLPHWRFGDPQDADTVTLVDRDGRRVVLPDRLAVADDGSFTVLGRRDGAVQVGGVNVWPDHVANVLRGYPGVADCAVRRGAHGRLKAFIVPVERRDGAALLERLEATVQLRLPVEHRPTHFTAGPALPRDALGKIGDW